MDTRRPSVTLRPPLGAARPKTLKRTISKCGLDASASANDLLAFKKLAPLQEPAGALHSHSHSHHHHHPHAFRDDGEPVLLPRDDLAPRGYYAASPSPPLALYGDHSPDSTVSFASTSSGSYSPCSLPRNNSLSSVALQDREYLSAANLHAVVVSYLDEMFQYYELVKGFTFGRVSEMVRSVPFAFRYIQGLVKNRLGISWHLVTSFVQYLVAFIGDEDLHEASVHEFADFLRSIQDKLYENMPPGNIFLNLLEFFQSVLLKFKKYLIAQWLAVRRIQYPCEFGKKSDTLFLCMECHREHW